MKRTIGLGRVDYNGTGRKNCMVEVELELKDSDKGPVFSVVGGIWNTVKSDYYTCGQCNDTIKQFLGNRNKLFNKIYRLWNLYHFNDIKAGTPEQEAAIKDWKKGNSYDYEAACYYLKSIGLYEVLHGSVRHKYGHSWLYQSIPADDLQEIKDIIGGK